MKSTPDIWERIRRRGVCIQGPYFTVYGLRLSPPPKLRVVVSAKIDKRAVVRNKVKRRIRDIISKGTVKGWGLIVIVKPKILDMAFQGLKEELNRALHHLT